MKQKIIWRLAVLLLLMSCFSGCGKKEAAAAVPQQTSQSEAEPAEPTPPNPERDLRGSGLTDGDLPDLYDCTYLTDLDLRKNQITAAGVSALQEALPQCRILWSVPVGPDSFDSDATDITLSDCTGEELQNLRFFYQLSHVDATACTDFEGLKAVIDQMPGCTFDWGVSIGGNSYPGDTQELDLSGADLTQADALAAGLSSLKNLKSVTFGGQTLSNEAMTKIAAACPGVKFDWNVDLFVVEVTGDAEEADLSGKEITDTEALLNQLTLLPALKKLVMCSCGLTNEDMEALRQKRPDIQFVWQIQVGNWELRTDITAFSSGNTHSFPGGRFKGGSEALDDEDVAQLKYCTDMVALDIGHKRKITDISFIKSMPKLRFLIVAMTGIDNIEAVASCPELEYLEVFQNFLNDWTPLLSLKKLTHLNVSTNFVKNGSEKSYPDYKILLKMPQLQRLWIIRDGFTDEQIEEIKAALPDCVVNTTGTHSTSNDWRKNDKYQEMQKLFNLAVLE